MSDPIAMLLDIFSTGFQVFLTAGDLTSILSEPFFMVVLPLVGFMVGTAVGASGIGGAALLLPTLVFLGIPPQLVVGTDLAFNFFTKAFGTALHSKKHNISWRAFIYVIIAVVPTMFLASWVWVFIKTSYGSKTLDSVILLTIGIILISITGFMVKTHVLKKKSSNSSEEAETTTLRTKFTKNDKASLLGTGGVVSFIMQITSVGAGSILVPVLLKIVRSPKHVAGTSVIFGVVTTAIGASLHYTLGNVPIYLVGFLLLGSVPGVLLGVKIASTVSPRKLTIIFTAIIFVAAVLLLNKGIGTVLG